MSLAIKGLKKATKNLVSMGKEVANDAGRRALTKPAALARKTLRRNVPVDSGSLKSSISSRRKTYKGEKGEKTHYAFIGPKVMKRPPAKKKYSDTPPHVYLRYVEFGTQERTGRTLRKPKSKARGHWHTGRIVARGPLKKTEEQLQGQIEDLFRSELRKHSAKSIEKIDKKVGRDIQRVR